MHGELSDRFVAHERLDEERLLAVFSGLPLRMTTAQRHGGMPVFQRVEIAMFFAAFALALADIAASGVPALATGFGSGFRLGWMLIPLVWLAGSARRTGRNRVPFAIGVGAMASVFCCVFLWLTPSWRPDQWGQAVLPALVVALIAAVLYAAGRRKFEPVRLAVVFLAALIAYAPGTVLCLNNLSNAWWRIRPPRWSKWAVSTAGATTRTMSLSRPMVCSPIIRFRATNTPRLVKAQRFRSYTARDCWASSIPTWSACDPAGRQPDRRPHGRLGGADFC